MVRIKKQYKQPDGTLIEVEGTEAEIEAFEKKQQKQKAQIEREVTEQRKKTILYGKDLEEIRKIVREEIAAARLTHTTYEYRYVPYYPYNPYWNQPLNPWYQPNIIWMGNSNGVGQFSTTDTKITLGDTNVSSGQITCTDAQTWVQANVQPLGDAVSVYSVAKDEVKPTNAVWSSFGTVKSSCGGEVPMGQTWSGILGGNNGSSNFLMSPRS